MKTPDQRRSLTEADWNFSPARVPDAEIVPCLLWEFLRESPTARQLGRDWAEWLAALDKGSDQEPFVVRTRALQLVINHPVNAGLFVYSAVVLAWGTFGLADVPWQRLHPETKKRLSEYCLANPSVFIGFSSDATELTLAAREFQQRELDKTPNDGTLHLPRARAPLCIGRKDSDCEALCLVVDWGRYDDNSIRADFAKLIEDIIKGRPKGTKPQVRREAGRENVGDWRSKLKNLGLTRLYASYNGVAALQKDNPEGYKFIASLLRADQGLTAVQKKLSSARQYFEHSFHKLLPFEKGNLPVCLARSRFAR